MLGVSFDVGQQLTNAERAQMRNSAINSGVWSYVEPAYLTPTWVHFDKRHFPPACPTGGYPLVRQGSRGIYVLALQDALNTLGFETGGLDGIFGTRTRNAVIAFQRSKGIAEDGIVGCQTWTLLMNNVVGKGKSASTID